MAFPFLAGIRAAIGGAVDKFVDSTERGRAIFEASEARGAAISAPLTSRTIAAETTRAERAEARSMEIRERSRQAVPASLAGSVGEAVTSGAIAALGLSSGLVGPIVSDAFAGGRTVLAAPATPAVTTGRVTVDHRAERMDARVNAHEIGRSSAPPKAASAPVHRPAAPQSLPGRTHQAERQDHAANRREVEAFPARTTAHRSASSAPAPAPAPAPKVSRMPIPLQDLQRHADGLIGRATNIVGAASTSKAAPIVGAGLIGSALVGAGILGGKAARGLATRRSKTPRKRKSSPKRKSSSSTKRKSSASRRKPAKRTGKRRGRKEDASGVMRSKYRGQQVYVTKRGQPYVYTKSGRPKFIPR